MSRKKVVSLDIDLIKYNDALTEIIRRSKLREPGYVCFANAHMVIEAHKDATFASQVNQATLVLPDGMPIINVLYSLYNYSQERVAGMDVLPDIIKLSEFENLKLFFFGTTDDLLQKLKTRVIREFPKVQIVGLFSPPFNRPLDDESYTALINESGANVVFVALGCPKQEKWMAEHSSRIKAMLLGVGGAFPIFTGDTKRAPLWIRKISLEWAFRLFQEPKRLFTRYLITNSLFLYLTFKVKLQQVFNISSQK